MIEKHLFERNIPTIFDKHNKFIYLCIEKNSQTSLIRGVLSDRVISKKDSFLMWEKYNKAQRIPSIVFAVIREPIERLLSTYFYFRNNGLIPAEEDINHFIQSKIQTDSRRVEKELHLNFNVWDHHLNPQFESIYFKDKIMPNVIIPMNENFQKNMNWLLERINCNKKMIQKNISSTLEEKKYIKNKITKESYDHLYNFYKKDFIMWEEFKENGLGIYKI